MAIKSSRNFIFLKCSGSNFTRSLSAVDRSNDGGVRKPTTTQYGNPESDQTQRNNAFLCRGKDNHPG
jgi:hypothetical protein